jgi:hypothetical protein
MRLEVLPTALICIPRLTQAGANSRNWPGKF